MLVLPFVGEAHCDPVLVEGPQGLGQPVLALALPFALQERRDLVAALQEFRAVAPAAVGRVRQRHPGGLAHVPRVLGEPHFPCGGVAGEWRQWRSEEHTSELESLMRISYAVFCLKNKKNKHK